MIELKGSKEDYKTEENLENILSLVEKFSYKKLRLHGFNHELLTWFKDKNPKLQVGIGLQGDFSLIKENKYDYVNFDITYMKNNLEDFKEFIKKNPETDLCIFKVDTIRELEIYDSISSIFSEDNMPSIMTNYAEGAKKLMKRYNGYREKGMK